MTSSHKHWLHTMKATHTINAVHLGISCSEMIFSSKHVYSYYTDYMTGVCICVYAHTYVYTCKLHICGGGGGGVSTLYIHRKGNIPEVSKINK